jgi:N-acetylneuraminate synthase
MSVLIIAEAGVNHNGKRELAFELVDAAATAGADIVKFQTFQAKNLVTRTVAKAEYQKQNGNDEVQYDMLKQLELSRELHFELMDHCAKCGIDFLSTAFDIESLEFLVKEIGLKTLKIPSGELTNGPFLLAHSVTGCDLILSTGMATLNEIEEALSVIAFGMIRGENPCRKAFQSAYLSQEGQELLQQKVTLLHCTSEYPVPAEHVNLQAMDTLRKSFNLNVGYSDHSQGLAVPTAAAALGATIIEKHFTVDVTLSGPDHKASLPPHQLKELVNSIRTVELAMGSGVKEPFQGEKVTRKVVRKTMVAACEIREGDIFSRENIDVKRAGAGRSPMEYWDLLGKTSKHDYRVEEIL